MLYVAIMTLFMGCKGKWVLVLVDSVPGDANFKGWLEMRISFRL
jgi:hypothetical protein